MTTAISKTATYKGKKYRLLWEGKTKYGRRCKLGFWDGSREFWADATAVTIGSTDRHGNSISDGSSYRAGVTAPHGRCCPECGRRDCAKAWDQYACCDDD